MVRYVFAAFALLFASQPAMAQGNLSIDKLWVEFIPGQPDRSDIVIRNDSQERYYITLTTSEVLNPGSEAEDRITRADPEEAGILVTPGRLILDPGAMRSIRLVSLNTDLTQDRIYRVLVAPEVVSAGELERAEGTQALQVKFLAAYDVLVIARPSSPRPDLQGERSDSAVTVTNKGNSNILLAEVYICPETIATPDAEHCRTMEAIRLYAGNSVAYTLEAPTERVHIRSQASPTSEMKSLTF